MSNYFGDLYNSTTTQLGKQMMEFPWDRKEAYAQFLAQTYYYTRHSTKLLTLASSRFDFADYDLHRRFIVHSQEERGHEFMCEKDLSVLGFNREDFPELTTTSAFYQRQYYLIEHIDPVCFMGYVFCLEGLSAYAAGKIKTKISQNYGEKPSLFLRAHSDEDPDHIEKAFGAIESISPKRLQLVAENLEQSCYLYKEMMKEAQTVATMKSTASGITAVA